MSRALGFASFRGRILALFIGVIALVQIATMVAGLVATRRNVAQRQRDALSVGGRVVEELLASREGQLLDRVEILTSDFAFREAVATGDRGTIESVLENHGGRVGANLVALLGLDGHVVAGATPMVGTLVAGQPAPEPFRSLLHRAESDGWAAAAALVAGRPYQLVLVPIEAPLRIAWIGMGFAIDDSLARELERLTALDVSFWGGAPGSEPRLFASTLGSEARRLLSRSLPEHEHGPSPAEPFVLDATDQLTVSLPLGDAPESELRVVLQSSLAEALAPWRVVRAQQLGIAAAALAVSVALAFALGRRITQPVNTLVAGAQRILGGRYDTAVAVTSRDELGLLARTFNEMQDAIAERERRIVHSAHHDALTGLPNRTVAREAVAEAIARARASRHELALLTLELGDLKAVNDSFGYAAGDRVLIEMATRLRVAADDAPLVARLGANVFLVALEATTPGEAESEARRVTRALRAPFDLEEVRLELSVHGGIALCPHHGDHAETLLRRSDIGLQDAKSQRRDVLVYELGRDERHLAQLALVRELRHAIAERTLTLHFQPKIDMLTGELTQAEALARWTHPERGPVPPDEFIPLAERAGLIFDITRQVLDGVARQWRVWADRGLQLGIAANLSAHDLGRAELPGLVHGLLSAYAMPPSALILELTESAVMEDPASAAAVLRGLREAGLRVAIDDFGTGHSSLSQLKRMPVDELKIDKSFVLGLKQASEDAAIVRSIVDLGHHLGLQVVAEGVEDFQAWDFLMQSRCDMVQGYYVSRPLPADAFEAFAREFAERTR
ncbi:MAG TPA: EAL domain-containing protein [Myxococcota bacterium]|nr:EAL domain-containing protein [Myxococcota bacterium]